MGCWVTPKHWGQPPTAYMTSDDPSSESRTFVINIWRPAPHHYLSPGGFWVSLGFLPNHLNIVVPKDSPSHALMFTSYTCLCFPGLHS